MRGLETFLLHPFVGLAVALVLTAIGWKLNAATSDWLLAVAWVLIVISLFRTPPLAQQPLFQRVLLVMLLSSLAGLGLRWLSGWRPPLRLSEQSIQERPHVRARLIIHSIKDGYAEYQIQVMNSSAVPITNLRHASKTSTSEGVESHALRPRLLRPGDSISILGGPEEIKTSGQTQNLRLTLRYNAQGSENDTDFISVFHFRMLPTQLKPGAVIDPISAEEPETVMSDQQGLESLVAKFAHPVGTFAAVIPEYRDGGKPNFVNIYEPEGAKHFQFDPVKRTVSFSMMTTNGRKVELKGTMQPTRSRTHVIHIVWNTSEGAALYVDGQEVGDGMTHQTR